jgi:UDP-N-acetylmuramoyl-L-alanyl-D-glutamate--2,6-diaminopimelate ligase
VNFDDPRGHEDLPTCAPPAASRSDRRPPPDARLRILSQRFDDTGRRPALFLAGSPHTARLNLIGGFQRITLHWPAASTIAAEFIPGEVFDVMDQLTTVAGASGTVARRDR